MRNEMLKLIAEGAGALWVISLFMMKMYPICSAAVYVASTIWIGLFVAANITQKRP